jgi:hypothetical protein
MSGHVVRWSSVDFIGGVDMSETMRAGYIPAPIKAQVVELRARRKSLLRKLSELCFLPKTDSHVEMLRKTVRIIDQHEDDLFSQAARSYGGTL